MLKRIMTVRLLSCIIKGMFMNMIIVVF
jgi:hypothetical protein